MQFTVICRFALNKARQICILRQIVFMAYFTTALETVLNRSFSGKQTALGDASGLHQSEIGRLIREETPLTAAKLAKLYTAEGITEADQHLLSQAAVRDFVGEDAYQRYFVERQAESTLRETLGGPEFRGLFPLNPRAEQVIRHIIAHAHEPDTATGLELLGKFLALP